MNDINVVLSNLYADIQIGKKTWNDVAEHMLQEFGDDRTGNAWSKIFHKHRKRVEQPEAEEVIYTNGDDVLDRIWESTQLSQDGWEIGKIKTWGPFDNLQVATEFKPRTIPTEQVLQLISDKLGRSNWVKPKKVERGGSHLLVACLFDAHIGKYTDGTDAENYYLDVLDDILNKAIDSCAEIGRVLFILGQDFAHVDNYQYTTTGGTSQEVNANYGEIIATQVSISVKAVEYLAQSYPVTILMVPGNHDRYSNGWLGHVMVERFNNHPNVTVDNGNNPRKYFKWGNTLIMSTHGDQENLNNLGNLIATEARREWGTTKYCEVLLGHLHTRKDILHLTDEKNGIMLRYLPSLSGTDTWHKLKGYVNNGRGGMGLIYSDTYGFESQYFSNLDKFLKTK